MTAHEDGMDRLKAWLDAVTELVDAVREHEQEGTCRFSYCRTCGALERYDEANLARNP